MAGATKRDSHPTGTGLAFSIEPCVDRGSQRRAKSSRTASTTSVALAHGFSMHFATSRIPLTARLLGGIGRPSDGAPSTAGSEHLVNAMRLLHCQIGLTQMLDRPNLPAERAQAHGVG